MRTLVIAALGAVLLFASSCSLTIDPDSVKPPDEKKLTPRGACVAAASGHELCGGEVSSGAANLASAGHKVARGDVGTSTPNVSSSQHKITQGDVSP